MGVVSLQKHSKDGLLLGDNKVRKGRGAVDLLHCFPLYGRKGVSAWPHRREVGHQYNVSGIRKSLLDEWTKVYSGGGVKGLGERKPGTFGPGIRGAGLGQPGQVESRQEVQDVSPGKEVPDKDEGFSGQPDILSRRKEEIGRTNIQVWKGDVLWMNLIF